MPRKQRPRVTPHLSDVRKAMPRLAELGELSFKELTLARDWSAITNQFSKQVDQTVKGMETDLPHPTVTNQDKANMMKASAPQSKGQQASAIMKQHNDTYKGAGKMVGASTKEMQGGYENRPQNELPQGAKYTPMPKPKAKPTLESTISTFEKAGKQMGVDVSKELAPIKKLATPKGKGVNLPKLPKGTLGVVGGVTTLFDAYDYAKDLKSTDEAFTDPVSGKKIPRKS